MTNLELLATLKSLEIQIERHTIQIKRHTVSMQQTIEQYTAKINSRFDNFWYQIQRPPTSPMEDYRGCLSFLPDNFTTTMEISPAPLHQFDTSPLKNYQKVDKDLSLLQQPEHNDTVILKNNESAAYLNDDGDDDIPREVDGAHMESSNYNEYVEKNKLVIVEPYLLEDDESKAYVEVDNKYIPSEMHLTHVVVPKQSIFSENSNQNQFGCEFSYSVKADIISGCDEKTMGKNGVMMCCLLLEFGSSGTLINRLKKIGSDGLPEIETNVFAGHILRGLNHIHGIEMLIWKPPWGDNRVLGVELEGDDAVEGQEKIEELNEIEDCILIEDADFEVAATNIVKGGFSCGGQWCIVVKVVLESLAGAFIDMGFAAPLEGDLASKSQFPHDEIHSNSELHRESVHTTANLFLHYWRDSHSFVQSKFFCIAAPLLKVFPLHWIRPPDYSATFSVGTAGKEHVNQTSMGGRLETSSEYVVIDYHVNIDLVHSLKTEVWVAAKQSYWSSHLGYRKSWCEVEAFASGRLLGVVMYGSCELCPLIVAICMKLLLENLFFSVVCMEARRMMVQMYFHLEDKVVFKGERIDTAQSES